jgi:hypothetical protein
MTFKVSRHGWLLDLPGHRDRLCAAPLALAGAIPAETGRRVQWPPVIDQGQPGSCAANANENPASDFWTIRVVQ